MVFLTYQIADDIKYVERINTKKLVLYRYTVYDRKVHKFVHYCNYLTLVNTCINTFSIVNQINVGNQYYCTNVQQ